MPKLGISKSTRLYLPSTNAPEVAEADKAWVEVTDKLLLGAVADITKISDKVDQTIAGIANFIKDWNYTEDGTENTPKLPVTEANVRKLDMQDFEYLAAEFEKAMSSAEQGLSKRENLVSTASSTGADSSTPTSTTQQITINTV